MKFLALFLSIVALGANAPKFEGELLGGGKFKLEEHLKPKRALFISFWATWCDPCLAEIKEVRKKLEADPSLPLDVVTVNIDNSETSLQVNATAKGQKINRFPIVLDPEKKIFARFIDNNSSVPFSVVVASDGKILETFQGLKEDMIEKIVKLAKAENAKKP